MLKKLLCTFFWIALQASPAHADTLSVACAANFTSAMRELATLYGDERGVTVNCTFGSTGMLYGQIIKGAPYDIFLAADERRPNKLHAEGYAEKPVPYALGTVVVWSQSNELASAPNWKEVVLNDDCIKVGIASPTTAPYGLKATEAMEKAGIHKAVEPKLAFGKSVGMAFQYAYSGAATASFVALSQALSDKGGEGTYWTVPEAAKVSQAACVVTKGNTVLALDFLIWMQTPAVKAVMEGYGYE